MNATLSPTAQAIYDLRRSQFYIQLFILVPLGTLGSLISIGVFLRKQFRQTAMGKYLIAQAVGQLFLQVYTIGVSLTTVFPPVFCQVIVAMFSLSMTHNSMIKTLVSLDRMVLVQFPTRMLFVKKTCFQMSMIVLVTVLSVVPLLLQFLTQYEPTGMRNTVRSCFVVREPFSLTVTAIYRYYDLYLCHIVPFLTMLFSGVVIITKVFRMKARMNKGKSGSRQNKELILAIYTVFVIVWWLFLNSFHIGILIYQIYIYNPFNFTEIYSFFQLFGLLMKNIEINSTFIIYILFNKLYRSELYLMGRLVFCCENKNGRNNTTHMDSNAKRTVSTIKQ